MLSALPVYRDAHPHAVAAGAPHFAPVQSREVAMLAAFMSVVMCAAFLAQRAPYDIRRGDDLSRLRTFGFKAVPPEPADAAAREQTTTYDSPIMDERINRAIAAELERRGLTRDDTHPDVWIVTRREFRAEQRYYPYPDPWFASGWGWPYGGDRYEFDKASLGPIYLRKVIRGSLSVELEDAQSGALLWRGVGDKRAHQTSKPSHRARRVDNEVEDIFELFPITPRPAVLPR
jgi:hypothetical protein